MSRSIDSPFAQFFGDLIGGHFSLFEEQGDEIMKALGFDVMKAEGASQHILRKGQAGGWTEHFSKEDEARLQEQLDARLPRTEASLAGVGAWRG